jgi:2-methylisocitrate lyase-like PEP mutase family enzyme
MHWTNRIRNALSAARATALDGKEIDMRSQADKAASFRALHERSGAFIIPNPWDAGTARLLAALGFEALATTSLGLANTLGQRTVSRDEILENCRMIAAATDLPVNADLENCGADEPKAAAECITLAAQAGAVGGSIEDATGDARKPIYDFALAIERVQAAAEVARALPVPLLLTARAENLLHGRVDLDDTIRRLQAYERAGADVLFAPALPDLAAVRTVCASLTRPVNFMVGIRGKSFSVAELAAAGVRRISLATSLYRAAMTGLIEAAREIRESGTFNYLDRGVSSGDFANYLKAPSK